jgi:hypothetical protein
MAKSDLRTKVRVAGMTGIQKTGQLGASVAPQDVSPYVDQTSKLNSKIADHCAALTAEHQAGYMKNDAWRHGVTDLPPRPQPPGWQKPASTGFGTVGKGMPPQPSEKKTVYPTKGKPGMR